MYLKKVDEICTNHKIIVSYLLYIPTFSFPETVTSELKPFNLEYFVDCSTKAPQLHGWLSKKLDITDEIDDIVIDLFEES